MRLLFVGDAVTLSHVVRPLTLARAAHAAGHEVTLACDARFDAILGEIPFRRISLTSAFSAEDSAKRLKLTAPMFDADILTRYVREDLRLFNLVQPDLVIGDMRQSLAISARVAGIPYAAIMNAHWSPYSDEPMTPAEHPLRQLLDDHSFERVFDTLFPIGSAYYTFPANSVRMKYGLPIVSLDIRALFCDADYVLYPDIPSMVPTRDLPPSHRYLGPIVWTADTPLPAWWDDIPTDRPVVSVNLGSSGEPDLLDAVVEALRAEDVTVVLATAGRTVIPADPPRLFTTDYLPADLAARRADMVVCSGGCMPVHPILAEGRPILSLPSNLDQVITARMFTRLGMGAHIERETNVTVARVREYARRILSEPSYRSTAERYRADLRAMDARAAFLEFLETFQGRGTRVA